MDVLLLPLSGMTEACDRFMYKFVESAEWFFKPVKHFTPPPAMYETSGSFTYLPILNMASHFSFNYSNGYTVSSLHSFNLPFPKYQ